MPTSTTDAPAAKKVAKPKTAKPVAATVVVKAATASPAAASSPTAAPVLKEIAPVLKKKELIERVIKAAGGKKAGVKEIVEATLAVLGAALSSGEDLNLPPLGRAKVNRQKDMPIGEMMIIKLRRGPEKPVQAGKGAGKKSGKDTLADPED